MQKRPKSRILVVDDRDVNLDLIVHVLSANGYATDTAKDGIEALEQVEKTPPDLILLDISMPRLDGYETCKRLKESEETKEIPVIFLTARTQEKDILKGFEVGAVDYVTVPFHEKELIARVRTHIRLKKAEQELWERLAGLQRTRKMIRIAAGIDEAVAKSPKMKAVMEKALLFHNSPDLSVAIEGETGVGKEIVARMIHYGDGGTDTPFMDINVAAMPGTLFESELFGYEEGAFTGASRNGSPGKLELAERGTLFLDEIGELSMDMQPKLLRVLQERFFYRLGGKKKKRFQARVVSASNRNLQEAVEKGQFRADLFHRINVGYIYIPPLRERKEEIAPLSEYFLKRFAKRYNTTPKTLSDEALAFLHTENWTGNVRELENRIETACLLTSQEAIPVENVMSQRKTSSIHTLSSDASSHVQTGQSHKFFQPGDIELPDTPLHLDELNQVIITKALEKFSGNKTKTAEYLGISRHALHRRLEKYGKPL